MGLGISSGAVIAVERLSKAYGRFVALDDVSLDIPPGITGLLGPNGAGKSTLIKCLLGLVRVSAGGGRVLGLDLRTGSRAIREAVGYMPEDDSYLTGVSGVEMVAFCSRLCGLPRGEALRRAHEILDYCGIDEERYREVQTYSTGMRQKLKFAQSIAHDPRLVILDEPTSGLDPGERTLMLDRIRALARRHGRSVLVSTHILHDVQQVCDTIVILGRGRVLMQESLEVLQRPVDGSLTVEVEGDGARFREMLAKSGLAAEDAGPNVFRVRDGSGDLPRRLFALARAADVGLRRVAPAQNSIEQIFRQALEGGR